MEKSKIASHIVNDIYEFSSKYEKLKNKFEEQTINKHEFANAQYILLSKIVYLSEVATALKGMGYKFAKYKKEMCVLESLMDNMSETLNLQDVTELSDKQRFSLSLYLTKYEEVVSLLDDIFEELKDHVEHN